MINIFSNKNKWAKEYIKQYKEMQEEYEKKLNDKQRIIDELNEKIKYLESCPKLKPRPKQITNRDIARIRVLKSQGYSYSYISNETGWSKATISRVINNKKNIY